MATIPETIESIAADVLPKRATSAANAWLGEYRTLRLREPIRAVRVHVGGGDAAATSVELATGAGIEGRWFAIGDVVQTYGQYRATRALPAHFSRIAIGTFERGAVVNAGYCAPLFGLPGGGAQLEFIDGPRPTMTALDATWSHEAGHA